MHSREEIRRAATEVRSAVGSSPLVKLHGLSGITGLHCVGKLESFLPTGSFKVRGASIAIQGNLHQARSRGVVTASTGNHGRAVAWLCRRHELSCEVYLSDLVPSNKRLAITTLGAKVGQGGETQDEAERRAIAASQEGALYVPPFNHPQVILGQSSVGEELLDADEDIRTIIVPVSGGGLAAGVLLAVKQRMPHVRVIGVTMERGAAMHASLRQGAPVEVPEVATLADSLGGGIGGAHSLTFPIVQRYLDDLFLVSEADIARGMRCAALDDGLYLEGAAACCYALLLTRPEVAGHGKTALILTGRNVSPATYQRVFNENPP